MPQIQIKLYYYKFEHSFFARYLVVGISKSVNCKKQPKIVCTLFVISLARSCAAVAGAVAVVDYDIYALCFT